MPVAEFTMRSMKIEILTALNSVNREHKMNLIGKGSFPGHLERRLRIRFNTENRELADRAFEELKANGHIRPTYDDIIAPESWVEITESGREALRQQCLDDLDSALAKISPTLVEMREGAWAAVTSRRPDSLRQASHSARELIDQTLKEGAPDKLIKQMAGFVPDRNSESGITRRHRLKYLMSTFQGDVSESGLRVADEACNLVIAADDRLKVLAHSRPVPTVSEVKDSLQVAEIALRRVLLKDNVQER